MKLTQEMLTPVYFRIALLTTALVVLGLSIINLQTSLLIGTTIAVMSISIAFYDYLNKRGSGLYILSLIVMAYFEPIIAVLSLTTYLSVRSVGYLLLSPIDFTKIKGETNGNKDG